MKKNLKKEIKNKAVKTRKNIKKNPVLSAIIAAFIMFFLYFTFFTPMAQCKRALKKYAPKTESHVLTLACQEQLKNK